MKVLIISVLIAAVSAASTSIPGGRVDADVNSDAVKDAAKFAYQLISSSLNTVHALKMGKVTKAQSQVVSGVKYYLTIEVEETDCARTATDMSGCKVISTKRCEADVLSRPWDTLHKKQLVAYVCSAVPI